MRTELAINNASNLFVGLQNMPLPVRSTYSLNIEKKLPEILVITTYPPRECGVATYSQDLIKALNNKFNHSFKVTVCPLESDNEKHVYNDGIKHFLNTDMLNSFTKLAKSINENKEIKIVVIQHEFGLFKKRDDDFKYFLEALAKPVIIAFHTVLPNPDEVLITKVRDICRVAESVIVMTNSSATILMNNYDIPVEKIIVIAHGTHLIEHLDKNLLKNKYSLSGKRVLSTFGLLSSGKSIETTLDALPAIVKDNPDILFLIIGKTHPSVVKQEGEAYRNRLEAKVVELKMEPYIRFINQFLPLPELLEYLQLTDIYLFTSKDPNQAVSGTFSYAISCGCPIISTSIPHAKEVLRNDAGILIDFENSEQLKDAVISLLNNDDLRKAISSNALHRIASTAWENSAIAHARLFESVDKEHISLIYNRPYINLSHIKKLTTEFGIIQFSKINEPDIESGYTLDDNARALIAMCQHFEMTLHEDDIKYITIYLNFIKQCLQPQGYFLNYIDEQKEFTDQNNSTNLADSNGRAIWALGYLISISNLLPKNLGREAETMLQSALLNINKIHSTRAMAFAIKGLYYAGTKGDTIQSTALIVKLANRLVQMYKHETDNTWQWFESYLTYANSILPEALLCAWLATGDIIYKDIAKSSFDFLLSKIFIENRINVVSNKNWLHKGNEYARIINGGEQPIDIAYTILALSKFHDAFIAEDYKRKMELSFDWFLGANHLQQIIYNPCTGGCYDGLEESNVNLNQGAESTVSYLMARLTVEKCFRKEHLGKEAKRQYMISHK